ncbi:MAG: hypothetical protein J0L71_13365, partial [Candidatus Accumulibacter sp.]|uniref:hypothetical protein n=1 Tax=Accumulibacter sp. TaxID=2053492 RepID=UPI001AC8EC49
VHLQKVVLAEVHCVGSLWSSHIMTYKLLLGEIFLGGGESLPSINRTLPPASMENSKKTENYTNQ